MLTIEYEQSLIETAVFLAVRQDEEAECAFHLAVDPLYEIPDDELRQGEFGRVFRNFFAKLELDRLIAGLIAERPLLDQRIDRCVVREAARKKAESGELLVHTAAHGEPATNRTLVIQVCPQSLIDSGRLVPRMRRELLHVSDMLDERFAYERETFDGPPSRQNLLRDRYRVLWDSYVEGRLEREGRSANGERQRLLRAFDRVYANDAANADAETFRRVFGAPALTHRCLMDWAQEPSLLFDSSSVVARVDALPAGHGRLP